MPLQVSIVTPEKEVWSGEATFVVARAEGGEIGVLPGHAPFLGSLEHARLKIEPAEGGAVFFAVHGGFVEVYEDRVTVLAPVAENASDIDIERAQRARELARAEDEKEGFLRAETRLHVAAAAGLASYD